MLKRFFITGTDTSVGKTVVSRALLQALASSGKSVAGYKPVAKGSKETAEGMRNKDALVLQSVSSLELPYEAINPIALSEEESSVAHSCPINYTLLSNGLASLSDKVDHVVVEGTGGWRSLMNDLRPLSEWVVQEQLHRERVSIVHVSRFEPYQAQLRIQAFYRVVGFLWTHALIDTVENNQRCTGVFPGNINLFIHHRIT